MREIRTITPTDMRVINRSAILALIRKESPISRSVIAERLDVSLPTVMRIIDELIDEGLVRPLGITEWSGGRRRSLLEFNARSQVMIGVDLGGTRLYGAAADLAGTILVEETRPLQGARGEAAYTALAALINDLHERARAEGANIRGIGVGVPGVTDYDRGVVCDAPALEWTDLPLRERLADRFGLPVIVDNDVNLSAMGELWHGSNQNINNLALIAVGSGIGAGIVVDGIIYRGAHQAAGEIGRLLPGREFLGCDYKTFGALESLASGAGIAERARCALSGSLPQEKLDALMAEDVFNAYRAGEAWAAPIILEAVDYLSIAIASLALLFDPEVIVLGGGVAGSADLLIPPILGRIEGALVSPPLLVASSLGHRAAVMGAITILLHQMSDFYMVRRMV